MENEVQEDEDRNFLGISRSTCNGTLYENVATLSQKINNERSDKEKSCLIAIRKVGEYLLDTIPIISTQSINQSINFIYPRIYSVALKC